MTRLTTPGPSPDKQLRFERYALILLWLMQALGWTLLPTLLLPNLPLDVNEGLVWGQAMQWGYYKHPPLQAWLLEATYALFGPARVAVFALAQGVVLLAVAGVYATVRQLCSERHAVLACLALVGVHYLTWPALELNPNTLLLPTWAWASYCFVRALRDHRWRDWLGLALCMALAFYAKYFSVILAVSFVLYLIINAQARGYWRWARLYAALALFLLLLTPHLYWLHTHDYMPLTYALSRGHAEVSWLRAHLIRPILFIAVQIAALALALLLIALLGRPYWGFKSPSDASAPSPTPAVKRICTVPSKLSLLTWLAWAPLVVCAVLAVVTGIGLRDMWGTPLLLFVTASLLAARPVEMLNHSKRLIVGAVTTVLALNVALAGLALSQTGLQRLRFQGAQLAQSWQARWPAAQPPYAIIATHWLGGNASYYSASRPAVLIEANPKLSPWINLDQLRRQGAVVLSCPDNDIIGNLELLNLKVQWQNQPLQIGKKNIRLAWVLPATDAQAATSDTKE